MHLIQGGCPQSHTGQGFSSCVFSCQRAKKSIVLGHFPFQFELCFFLIWSWSIPAGASKIRCSTRVFAVSKTAATDHSRHESTKCEQDSKSFDGQKPSVGSNPTPSAIMWRQKRCLRRKARIYRAFLLPIRLFFSVPKHRCKIAVFPLWIDLNSRKENIRYARQIEIKIYLPCVSLFSCVRVQNLT